MSFEWGGEMLRKLGLMMGVVCMFFAFFRGGGCTFSPGPGGHGVSFAPAASFPTGPTPVALAAGDVNSDTFQDVVVVNGTSGTGSAMLGNGAGALGPPLTLLIGGLILTSVGLADFDGDGDLDVAITDAGVAAIPTATGLNTGIFIPSVVLLTVPGVFPADIIAAQLNVTVDGDFDLATCNSATNDITVFLGGAGATFGPGTIFATGGIPVAMISGEFNGDGFADLATSNTGTDDVSVLLGNGAGAFGAAAAFVVGIDPFAIATGDFNGDAIRDIVTANTASNDVSVLRGNGDGTFQAAANFSVAPGSAPSGIAVGDFNSDGRLDVATANTTTNNVSVLQGLGNGTFAAAVTFPVGLAPTAIVAADFNGDAKPDLGTTDSGGGTVSILLQQ